MTSTVLFNLASSESQRLQIEMQDQQVLAERLPVVRAVMERRAKTFVQALEKELRSDASSKRKGSMRNIGLYVLAWESEQT